MTGQTGSTDNPLPRSCRGIKKSSKEKCHGTCKRIGGASGASCHQAVH